MERNILIPAVYMIIEKDGECLFLRRYLTGYEDGKLSLPAGHIEKNETPYEATIREANEELNIIIDPQSIEIQHVCYRYKVNRIDYYVKVIDWTGALRNNEPNKCSELIWLTEPNYEVIPIVKDSILNIRKGIMFSESLD